jgi:hypothetical protein
VIFVSPLRIARSVVAPPSRARRRFKIITSICAGKLDCACSRANTHVFVRRFRASFGRFAPIVARDVARDFFVVVIAARASSRPPRRACGRAHRAPRGVRPSSRLWRPRVLERIVKYEI